MERGGCIMILDLPPPPAVVHADNNIELQGVMRTSSCKYGVCGQQTIAAAGMA